MVSQKHTICKPDLWNQPFKYWTSPVRGSGCTLPWLFFFTFFDAELQMFICQKFFCIILLLLTMVQCSSPFQNFYMSNDFTFPKKGYFKSAGLTKFHT